jgi:hypothetical protein
VDPKAYWAVVGNLLDQVLPEGLPADTSLTLPYDCQDSRLSLLSCSPLYFDLLHEALKDPEAKDALPRLRELCLAWREGRIHIDYRAWKKTRKAVIKGPDPDFGPLPLPSNLDQARLNVDLGK